MKKLKSLTIFITLLLLTMFVNKTNAQELKIDTASVLRVETLGFFKQCDTIQVIYVILRETRDSFTLDTTYTIEYPYLDAIYGYYVETKWYYTQPYEVYISEKKYYNWYWKLLDESDIIHIKPRKHKK